MRNLNVDPNRRHLKEGERCGRDCTGTIRRNHDNFECPDCSFTDWDVDKPSTGLFVRARFNDAWGDYDLAELDRESLLAWISSKPPATVASIVLVLMGHPK